MREAIDRGGTRRTFLVEAATKREAEQALVKDGMVLVEAEAPVSADMKEVRGGIGAGVWATAVALATGIPLLAVAAVNFERLSVQWLAEFIGYCLPGAFLLLLPLLLVRRGLRNWDCELRLRSVLIFALVLAVTLVGLLGEERGTTVTLWCTLALLFLGLLVQAYPGSD